MRKTLLPALLLLITTIANAAPAPVDVLPFVENDYAKAVASAKAKHVPLFIDAWAPWCHTCRSMRAYVFTDKALAHYSDRFVWLAIDTENPKNASFLGKYPINVWPTLLIVDPKTEQVAVRYAGGATVTQLGKLLDDGRRSVQGLGSDKADTLLTRADRLAGDQKNAEAVKLYEEALASAPAHWSSRGRAAESYIFMLTQTHDSQRCATQALALYPPLVGTLSGANVALEGLSCAVDLDASNPKRAELFTALEKATRQSLDNPKIDLSGDDRSGLFESLIEARQAQKDDAGAKKLAQQWATFLEGEASKAKTNEQRAVYDPHRLTAYIQLGTPEKAVPMLQESERDFPSDYNPPARLALIYKTMGKYNEAIASSDRAMKLAYGPRKLGIYRTRAEIYTAKGDKAAAAKTIDEAIQYGKNLPTAQQNVRTIAALEKQRSEIK